MRDGCHGMLFRRIKARSVRSYGFAAVSYTHLDVYKRQVFFLFSKRGQLLFHIFKAQQLVHDLVHRPVSYTHLDVYKRQGVK